MSTSRTQSLILVPALLTLALTLLRLTGELLDWNPALFNKAAGGGGSLLGITWLVPILGFYFAWRLMDAQEMPAGLGRVFGFTFLGIAAFVVCFMLAFQMRSTLWLFSALNLAGALLGLFFARKAWPALYSTLLAYGLAARIPVVIVMFIAIMNNWGTHYDVPPPDFPETSPLIKWVLIGLFPQLTFWMAFTVTIGLLFGGLAVAALKRRFATAHARA